MKIFGKEFKFNGFDVWHKGNFNPDSKQEKLGYTPVNKAGDTISGTLNVDRYMQNVTGIPTSNLGSPSVTEMALFDSQFTNKLWFYDPTKFIFEYTNDGVNWIIHSISIDTIKAFVSENSNANIQIPHGCLQYRITILNCNNYVFLNALYAYFSTSGNSTKVQIFKKRNDGNWIQHTGSNSNVSSWPGHLYLPFANIPWSQSSTDWHYHQVRILFIPNWSHATNSITLYGLELWGGYPSGSRNIYTWDSDKNINFPAELKAKTLRNFSGTEVTYEGHKHKKSEITDMPTKLSEFTNDIGAGGGTNIVCSSTEPSIKPGEWWYKE